jgi:hypothetical protein
MPTTRPLGEPDITLAEPERPPATVTYLTRRLPARPAAPDRGDTDDSLQKLAVWTEAQFKSRGLTLTDETTAQAHQATLDVLDVLLSGALRLGKLDESTHLYLSDVLKDSRAVPDVI